MKINVCYRKSLFLEKDHNAKKSFVLPSTISWSEKFFGQSKILDLTWKCFPNKNVKKSLAQRKTLRHDLEITKTKKMELGLLLIWSWMYLRSEFLFCLWKKLFLSFQAITFFFQFIQFIIELFQIPLIQTSNFLTFNILNKQLGSRYWQYIYTVYIYSTTMFRIS